MNAQKKENEPKMETKKIKITFIQEVLGTVAKNKTVYHDYIMKKAVDKGIEIPDDETETVEEMSEKAWTGFHSDENGIFLYDYLIKGNIKANIETLIMAGSLPKISAYKMYVDRVVFVYPRRIPFYDDDNVQKIVPDDVIERPLRCMTMQGPRVTLSKSDYVNVGSTLVFEITLLPNPKITWDAIEKALDYGKYYGIGQWRGSGGYGRFEWEFVK